MSKLVVDGRRSPKRLADVLQKIVDESSWTLHLHPTQEAGGVISGFELEEFYDGPEFNDRHRSLDSPEVRGWIANPTTYPEKFKDKMVFLWGSRKDSGDLRQVAFLFWFKDRVRVHWNWLGVVWNRLEPALLANLFFLSRLGGRVFFF